jgi:cyclase
MRRVVVLVILTAVGSIAVAVKAAQTPPAQPQTAAIEKVKENLYMITGGGGNTAVLVGESGVLLVDTKLRDWGERIMEKVRTVTDKPVTTIINTHTHGDHTGSNVYFDPKVQIVAHKNTKANMARDDSLPQLPHVLPDRTFDDRVTIGKGRDRVELHYFGRSTWGIYSRARARLSSM